MLYWYGVMVACVSGGFGGLGVGLLVGARLGGCWIVLCGCWLVIMNLLIVLSYYHHSIDTSQSHHNNDTASPD